MNINKLECDLKDIFILSMIPFLFMSLVMMLLGFIGASVVTGEVPLDEIEDYNEQEEQDVEKLKDILSIILTIYPIYITIEILLIISIVIVISFKKDDVK